MNMQLTMPGVVTYHQSHSVALSLTSNIATNNEAGILIQRLAGFSSMLITYKDDPQKTKKRDGKRMSGGEGRRKINERVWKDSETRRT